MREARRIFDITKLRIGVRPVRHADDSLQRKKQRKHRPLHHAVDLYR